MLLTAVLLVGLFDVQHFRPAEKTIVPRSVIESNELCEPELKSICWEHFLEVGEVWQGDVNGDGKEEVLVQPGIGGSGGDWYFLFEERGEMRVLLNPEGWFVHRARFDILPRVRNGYGDIRIAVNRCYKWGGEGYVEYSPDDYHNLKPDFFDAVNPDEAEILWSINYEGLTSFELQRRWFPVTPKWAEWSQGRANARLKDPREDITWVALYKEGVWGVRGNRAFLVLPRPTYKGIEKLGFEGEWLVMYGETSGVSGLVPLAKYNRRTGKLVIEQKGWGDYR